MPCTEIGHAVAQLIEALRYKLEPSNRNKYQEYFLGGGGGGVKGAGALG
jgi:hypothetical protein